MRDLIAWNLQPRPGTRSWHGGPSPLGALRGVPAEEAAWSRDVALLREQHEGLVEAVARVPMTALDRIPPEARRWTYGQLLLGIAAHDAYHTGQIQLMKRLWHERKALPR